MADSIPVPSTSTFVLHFWREWSSTRSSWRGWVKHVQSGQRAAFQDEASLLCFIHSFGISYNEDGQPEKIDLSK
jgi:hypothetical protein